MFNAMELWLRAIEDAHLRSVEHLDTAEAKEVRAIVERRRGRK